VKIATFNINNVNRRLLNLLDWLESAKPDAFCLQELKADDRPLSDATARLTRPARRRRLGAMAATDVLNHHADIAKV
jgi:exonuclease III